MLKRTIVCGDIHGAHKALLQCLERSGFDKENDELIQLGDVADGWSEVFECVETLLSIKHLIPIMGNHDYWTLDWMKNGWMIPDHKSQGGAATMFSYSERSSEDRERHLNFFNRQQLFYVDSKNRCFVHGGFNRDYILDSDTNVHNHSWNRTLWKQALSCKGVKLKTIDNFEEIYIGHTATTQWDQTFPMKSGGVTNMDTGAGYMGKLSFMDINTYQVWQSDPVQELYFDEKGRN